MPVCRVVETLDPEMVDGEKQLTLSPIPQRQRKAPPEPANHAGTFLRVQSRHQFVMFRARPRKRLHLALVRQVEVGYHRDVPNPMRRRLHRAAEQRDRSPDCPDQPLRQSTRWRPSATGSVTWFPG